MSLNRYAKKADATQVEVVETLRKAGVQCWVISQPCDLLTYHRGIWRPLEVKPLKKRNRKDQERQSAFLATYGVPVVRSGLEALLALSIARTVGIADRSRNANGLREAEDLSTVQPRAEKESCGRLRHTGDVGG